MHEVGEVPGPKSSNGHVVINLQYSEAGGGSDSARVSRQVIVQNGRRVQLILKKATISTNRNLKWTAGASTNQGVWGCHGLSDTFQQL